MGGPEDAPGHADKGGAVIAIVVIRGQTDVPEPLGGRHRPGSAAFAMFLEPPAHGEEILLRLPASAKRIQC
eukprot:5997673-Lingulodinium_polyedra.AAC.1